MKLGYSKIIICAVAVLAFLSAIAFAAAQNANNGPFSLLRIFPAYPVHCIDDNNGGYAITLKNTYPHQVVLTGADVEGGIETWLCDGDAPSTVSFASGQEKKLALRLYSANYQAPCKPGETITVTTRLFYYYAAAEEQFVQTISKTIVC